MRRNRIVEKIAGGVLTIAMVIGIGMAAGSTANAAGRDYGRDRFHSSEFRDGRDRGDRYREGDREHRLLDRDGWYWVRAHGRWIHERRSINWGDGRRDRR